MSPREPFLKCPTVAPEGPSDYRRGVILSTLALGPHSLSELYHATGIPLVELGPIVTVLFRDKYIQIVRGERNSVPRYFKPRGSAIAAPTQTHEEVTNASTEH